MKETRQESVRNKVSSYTAKHVFISKAIRINGAQGASVLLAPNKMAKFVNFPIVKP